VEENEESSGDEEIPSMATNPVGGVTGMKVLVPKTTLNQSGSRIHLTGTIPAVVDESDSSASEDGVVNC
jgi:hypothetical protein